MGRSITRTRATMSMCSRNKKDVDEHRSSDNMTTTRKGPWTVEEDAQLVRFVRLFGERRWDFLAKVSGLRRTGKSCRLRWVNYLHPGLRRGCITADEERLVVELHARWGSRWSRIARSLPGRTDNEIKNFWRTRTRKHRALEERRQTNVGHDTAAAAAAGASASSTSATTASRSSSGGSPNSGGTATTTSSAVTRWAMRDSRSGGDDDAEVEDASTTTAASQHQHQHQQQLQQDDCLYTMDQLWNEIAAADAASYGFDVSWDAYHRAAAAEVPSSPVWELSSDYCSLWRIDDDEYYKKMLDASS